MGIVGGSPAATRICTAALANPRKGVKSAKISQAGAWKPREKVNSIAVLLPSVPKGSHQLDHFLLLRALLFVATLGIEKADRDTRGLGVRDKPSATAVSIAAVP